MDLVPHKRARMRKAVNLQAALEVVKERQEEFMAHITRKQSMDSILFRRIFFSASWGFSISWRFFKKASAKLIIKTVM